MLPFGMILAFAGYGFGTWGWILVKGYNITLREWFSPLHPYQGALDANGTVPKGSIFPTSGKGSSGTTGGTSAPVLRPGQTSQTGQGSGNPTESRF